EGNRALNLTPQLFNLDRGFVFSIGPEQTDHLSENSDRAAARRGPGKQSPDNLSKEPRIGRVVHHQARQGLARIDGKISARPDYSGNIEAESVESLLESIAMVLCRDCDAGEALGETCSNKTAKRIQQKRIGVVELNIVRRGRRFIGTRNRDAGKGLVS